MVYDYGFGVHGQTKLVRGVGLVGMKASASRVGCTLIWKHSKFMNWMELNALHRTIFTSNIKTKEKRFLLKSGLQITSVYVQDVRGSTQQATGNAEF